ncbi:hypothetical protein WA588_002914, partial [Blastocystis sp. NMH]
MSHWTTRILVCLFFLSLSIAEEPTSKTKVPICGTYTIPCQKTGIKFDYVFYGDLKTAPTRVELITTNYKEMQCKRLRMITRRVYQIQNMTYAMFDKSYVMKPTLILQSTFITYSKPIVVDTVTCKNGYKHLVEFDINDNFCTDSDPSFDYNALLNELGSYSTWNLLFSSSALVMRDTEQTIVRSSSSGCVSFLVRYRVVVQILVWGLFFLLLLAFVSFFLLRRRKPRFMPLATEPVEAPEEPTNSLFTLNTFDRIQRQV